MYSEAQKRADKRYQGTEKGKVTRRKNQRKYYYSEYGHKTSLLRGRRRSQKRKLEVLTHYGKDGKLCCCWRNCKVSDIDMLTLDHIKDNGCSHRKTIHSQGNSFYAWLKARGFPNLGLQTLCWNHQWKKRMLGGKYVAR